MTLHIKYPYLTFSLFALMTGCKVGPDYRTPETPMPIAYTEAKSDKTFFVKNENLVTWWKIFNDPFLNSLLEETVAGSFDYRIALE